MPIGLQNIPDTFQRTMNVILSSVKWQFTLVHMDDIMIYSETPKQHTAHVCKVLLLL